MKPIIERIKSSTFLTDGGLETDLIFNKNIDLPHFASFPLLDNPRSTKILRNYYVEYLEIALKRKTAFLLDSPTWRANIDWGFKLGYTPEDLYTLNLKAIQMLQNLKDSYENNISDIIISGQIGPRGDGYQQGVAMSIEEAQEYHSFQVKAFKEAGADMVSALTMTYIEEAIGITLSAKSYKLPVVISFTVETDGRLPSGMTLEKAIMEIDNITEGFPSYYMINCAHPQHFIDSIDEKEKWVLRIMGIRSNASCKSHAELDEATELDSGNKRELAQWHLNLINKIPELKVIGGCCGTDASHIDFICSHIKSEELTL